MKKNTSFWLGIFFVALSMSFTFTSNGSSSSVAWLWKEQSIVAFFLAFIGGLFLVFSIYHLMISSTSKR